LIIIIIDYLIKRLIDDNLLQACLNQVVPVWRQKGCQSVRKLENARKSPETSAVRVDDRYLDWMLSRQTVSARSDPDENGDVWDIQQRRRTARNLYYRK